MNRILHHYGPEAFKEILTRRLQGRLSSEEEKDEIAAMKFRGEKVIYSDHISAFGEPVPFKNIASVFPKDHHTWVKGKEVFHHEFNTKDIELIYWKLSESPLHVWMAEHLFFDQVLYKKFYFRISQKIRTVIREEGSDYRGLIRAIDRVQGQVEQGYKRLKQRKNYDEIKYMYAGTIPHFKIYTKSPVKPFKVTKIIIDDIPFSQEQFPLSVNW